MLAAGVRHRQPDAPIIHHADLVGRSASPARALLQFQGRRTYEYMGLGHVPYRTIGGVLRSAFGRMLCSTVLSAFPRGLALRQTSGGGPC